MPTSGPSLSALDSHTPLLSSVTARKVRLHAVGRDHYPGRRLAADELVGLLSAGYWDARGDQGWGMESHRNEGVELCLLETGSMTFAVDGKLHPLGPGTMTVTRPWQTHRQGDPYIAPSRLHWVTLDVAAQQPEQPWHWPAWVLLSADDRRELTLRLRQSSVSVWRASPDVLQGFRRIAAAVERTADGGRLSLLTLGLNELLFGVLELLRTESRPKRPGLAAREHRVRLFLAELKQDLTRLGQPWTLGAMAAACGAGTTFFSRVCRMLTNESPARYLKNARLDAAARLLRERPDCSVTAIAFDCGFQSSQHFAHQFHERFGQTPSQHRKLARSAAENARRARPH